jgi:hypothetical protein
MLTRLLRLPKPTIIPAWLAITSFVWFLVGWLPAVAFFAVSWIILAKRLEDLPSDSTDKSVDCGPPAAPGVKDDGDDAWKWIGT